MLFAFYFKIPPGGTLGNWNEWQGCEGGNRTRTRPCDSAPCDPADLTESESCSGRWPQVLLSLPATVLSLTKAHVACVLSISRPTPTQAPAY